jgi:drug/metabolite transporter (DMT)-like permease
LIAGSGRLDARAIGLAVLAMAVLGGSYTAGKIALQDLPPFGLLSMRMAITTAVLGAYAAVLRMTLAQPAAYVVAQTAFFALSQALLFIALGLTSAGRVAILFNTQPFFTLLLLPLFFSGERVTPRRWLGTGVAFGGVALVLAERGAAGGSPLGDLRGDLLAMAAALCWTANIVLNKRMPGRFNAVAMVFWNCAGAALLFGLLSWQLESPSAWRFTVPAMAGVVYLGVVAACLGFVLVAWLTRTYSASRVNVFVFLSPIFGVLIGWALLGEAVSLQQALGALAVAAGILIVTAER